MPALLLIVFFIAIAFGIVVTLYYSIIIWAGTLAAICFTFLLAFIYKTNALNDATNLSRLVVPRFDGLWLNWEINESACKAYPNEDALSVAAGFVGLVWLVAVCSISSSSSAVMASAAANYGGNASIFFTSGVIASLIFGGYLIFHLARWYSKLLRSAILERIQAVQASVARGRAIGSLEQEIAATSAQIGFTFPLTFSSSLDAYIQNNKATLIVDLLPFKQKIMELTADAEQVLASLEEAGNDLKQAKKIYDDSLRIVTKSGSVALIQGLEQIYAYLNTTALTEFLSARRWQDFKEAVADAIKEMEHLTEVSKDYKNSQSETYGESNPEQSISRERALNILGLKEGCSPDEIKRAWREGCKKWNVDQRQDYEPHILEKIQEQFKDVNEAKDVLLGKA